MVGIFVETHKTIGQNICQAISQSHDIELNMKNFVWGAVLPDIHPKYRSMSHYPDQSIDYIVKEINSLIFIGRFIDFKNDAFYGISNKLFSRKLGIISHFLADAVCLPHYENWTFYEALTKHVKYEKNLAKLANDYEFRSIDLRPVEYKTNRDGNYKISDLLEDFLMTSLEAYKQEKSMETDLDFSFNINLLMTEFVLDTIELYNKEKSMEKLLVF